ncbi:MAG: hypothetical protein R3275_02300 [Saprospiraceae bacterium]|nr:hypothetical protein [Saprospiraceae bacterium]
MIKGLIKIFKVCTQLSLIKVYDGREKWKWNPGRWNLEDGAWILDYGYWTMEDRG